MTDLGHQIQRLRKARGMSQDDLARAAGASRNIIGRYERGESQPSAELAARLAAALDVTVGELLGLEVPTERPDPEATARIEAIAGLDPDTRQTVYRVIDAIVRDASARKAYAA